eukprot:3949937-Prymnesium_polylepis.1
MAPRDVPVSELLAAAGHHAGARQPTIGHIGGGERGIGMDTPKPPPLSNADDLRRLWLSMLLEPFGDLSHVGAR